MKKIFYSALSYMVFMPLVSFAQIKNPIGPNNPDLRVIITTILGYITKVGAMVAVVAFIYVGFVFVKAQGKPEEIKKAKGMFFWTVIGVAILLGANLLAQLVWGTISSLGTK